MQYNADILLNLKYNERSLNRVAATVGRVQALAKQIKPINLFAPGAGAGADQINVAMRKIQDRAKSISKLGSAQISATYAGAAQTADAFAEVLRNVNIEAKKGTVSLDAQSDQVRDLALAYAEAASKANLLSDRYDTIIQQARQQLGLQIGPATRLGTVEADAEAAAARAQATYQAQINKNLRTDVLYQRLKLNLLVEQSETLLKQDSLMARLAKKAADYGGAGKFTENLALGVGFPLLFGGGPGSVLGSALGSFFGKGFGGQILGGALGAQLDTAVKKAIDLGNAVRDVDLERLQELGILITQDLKTQVQLYKQIGDQTAAQAVVAEQVAIQTGVFAEAQQDVANAGNLLNGTWQNFTATISNTVGLIGTPFAAALTGALTIVNGLLKSVNFIASGFGLGIKRVAEFVVELTGGETALKNLNAWITMFNGKLDDGVDKAAKLTAELSKRISGVDIKLNLAQATQIGGTVSDKLSNVNAQKLADLDQLRLDYLQDQRDLAFDLAGASKDAIDTNYELLKIEYNKNKQLIEQEATNKRNLILRQEGEKLAREEERRARRANKAAEAASDLTQKLQRQLEVATAKTDQDKEALRILFEYEDNVEAIRKLEDQSQAARQSKIADELYSLELNRLATDELTKYLNTLISIAAVSPGLGRQAFRGTALQGALQTDVGLAFGTQANLAEATPEDIQLQKAKDRLEELIAPINQVETAAKGIGSAFTDSFKSVIDGTATTQEALANMFNRIADAFFDMAAQIITQMLVIKAIESTLKIFGGGGDFKGFSGAGPVAYPSDLSIGTAGFRANGGPVSAGSPYVVGERGPELFVPNRSGTIVSNENLGGETNVVVNVDASGSNVEGNDQDANQLGKAIGLAVQQELIKQKRPGGLLAGV